MKAKNWIARFLAIVAVMVVFVYGSLHVLSQSYPLPVFNSISLDAKLHFLNRKMNIENADTIIIGSSVGLNNIDGELLEKLSASTRMVVNYSAWGLNPVQVEQLLPAILENNNVKRILFAAQPGDFSHAAPLGNYDGDLVSEYIHDDLSFFSYLVLLNRSAGNLKSYRRNIRDWEGKYRNKHATTSLVFDSTGSVNLDISGKYIDQEQWNRGPTYPEFRDECFSALERIMDMTDARGIWFYFLVQPVRREPLASDARLSGVFSTFIKSAEEVVLAGKGRIFNMHETMNLDDRHFANLLHLNTSGAHAATEELARILDAGN